MMMRKMMTASVSVVSDLKPPPTPVPTVSNTASITDGMERSRTSLNAASGVDTVLLTKRPKSKITRCLFSEYQQRFTIGILAAILNAGLFVELTRVVHETLSDPTVSFNAPFCLVYFSSTWAVCVFPLRILFRYAKLRGQVRIRELISDSFYGYGEENLLQTVYKLIFKCFGFSVLWSLTCYLYLSALGLLGIVDCVAVFSSYSNFVYFSSWTILKKNFAPMRIIAFIVAMSGVIIIVHSAEHFNSRGILGGLLGVACTMTASLYKVLYRRVFGDVTFDQLSLCVSCVGLAHLVTMWIPSLILLMSGVEHFHLNSFPWLSVCLASLYSFTLNCLQTFGANSKLFPFFLHAGFVVSIPLAIGYLGLSGGVKSMLISGYAMLAVAFLLDALPENPRDVKTVVILLKQKLRGEDVTHLEDKSKTRIAPSIANRNL